MERTIEKAIRDEFEATNRLLETAIQEARQALTDIGEISLDSFQARSTERR